MMTRPMANIDPSRTLLTVRKGAEFASSGWRPAMLRSLPSSKPPTPGSEDGLRDAGLLLSGSGGERD